MRISKISLLATLLLTSGAIGFSGCLQQTGFDGSADADATNEPIPAVDESAKDKSVPPCKDFFRYTCGSWMKTKVNLSDGRYSKVFTFIYDKIRGELSEILAHPPADNGIGKQLREHYQACLQAHQKNDPAQSSLEKKGMERLKQELAIVGKVQDGPSLALSLGYLMSGIDDVFFGIGVQKNDSATGEDRRVVSIYQPGLSLPRTYYLESNTGALLAYAKQLFMLNGSSQEDASKQAQTVVRIETDLAKGFLPEEDLTDPKKNHNEYSASSLASGPGAAAEGKYAGLVGQIFDSMGIPPNARDLLIVSQPSSFKHAAKILSSLGFDDVKTYLSYKIIAFSSVTLSSRFIAVRQVFLKAVDGTEEQPPTKQCAGEIGTGVLGEALGKLYVAKHFNEASKKEALEILSHIKDAMKNRLSRSDLLEGTAPSGKAVRAEALEKLEKMGQKLAYPDEGKWFNYDGLSVGKESYYLNHLSISKFKWKRSIETLGQPEDPLRWDGVTPQDTDYYYEATLNQMVFPAGSMQPPAFSPKSSLAYNYGMTGFFMGHEMTHGFDSDGRRYDGKGQLHEWWSKEMESKFTSKSDCVEKQYGKFSAFCTPPKDGKDVPVNGKLTLAENIADLGGLRNAHDAFLVAQSKPSKSEEKEFFEAFGQTFCRQVTEALARKRAAEDAHAPSHARVNGVVANMPEFAEAFDCKPGDPMVRSAPVSGGTPKDADRCEVWLFENVAGSVWCWLFFLPAPCGYGFNLLKKEK